MGPRLLRPVGPWSPYVTRALLANPDDLHHGADMQGWNAASTFILRTRVI
ncbi:MAG: hypothetical protein JRH01_20540 [Deltaproteobacteria bacterium]|nr:hypothetical protein [Deltaproteobacteria bacterium]MBW2393351.1 hypothetical protein [Deltaproteobacteria bacterium]